MAYKNRKRIRVVAGAAFVNAFNGKKEPVTILEWINTLDPEIKEKALKYKQECWSTIKDEHPPGSLSYALQQGFIFSDTDEGRDYWLKIIQDIEEKIK